MAQPCPPLYINNVTWCRLFFYTFLKRFRESHYQVTVSSLLFTANSQKLCPNHCSSSYISHLFYKWHIHSDFHLVSPLGNARYRHHFCFETFCSPICLKTPFSLFSIFDQWLLHSLTCTLFTFQAGALRALSLCHIFLLSALTSPRKPLVSKSLTPGIQQLAHL